MASVDRKRSRGTQPQTVARPTVVEEEEEEEEEDISEDDCAYCLAQGFLNICDVRGCGKVYHAECLGYTPGDPFQCPRHRCCVCKRGDEDVEPEGGVELFSCNNCPSSYCADHRPDDSAFKKAMSMSTVEALPDSTFLHSLVPLPDAPTAAGVALDEAAKEVAFTDIPAGMHEQQIAGPGSNAQSVSPDAVSGRPSAGPDSDQEGAAHGHVHGHGMQEAAASGRSSVEQQDENEGDVTARPAKRARVQFALESGIHSGASSIVGPDEGGEEQGEKGDNTAAAPAAPYGTRGASRRKSDRPPLPPPRGTSNARDDATDVPGLTPAHVSSMLSPTPSSGGDASDVDSIGGGRKGKKRKHSAMEGETTAAGASDKEGTGQSGTPAPAPLSLPLPSPASVSSSSGPDTPAVGKRGVDTATANKVASEAQGAGKVTVPATPSGSKSGSTAAGAGVSSGVLTGSTVPTSGAALALAAGKAKDKKVDPVLAEKERERGAGRNTGFKCIHCAAPSVRVAFAQRLEAAWVDVVIRILGKREGKEDPTTDGIRTVQDAGLVGMGMETAAIPLSSLGPHTLVQAFMSPVTDPDAQILYLSLGHGRKGLGLPPPSDMVQKLSTTASSSPHLYDQLLAAVKDSEPSVVAAVFCKPHESSALPTRPACLGDVLANIRACVYTKVGDVIEDIKHVTRVAGVLAGALAPDALGAGAGASGQDAAAGAGASTFPLALPQAAPYVPTWAMDSASGEVDEAVVRAGLLPGALPLPTVDVSMESGSGTPGGNAWVHQAPISSVGPLTNGNAERLATSVAGGLADNPRVMFYQASVTVADAFSRKLLKDRKAAKQLRDLESRLGGQQSWEVNIPAQLNVLPPLSPSFIESLYAPLKPASGEEKEQMEDEESATEDAGATPSCPHARVWLMKLISALELTPEDALTRLRAARLSCTRPELSWTHHAYSWPRHSLTEWVTMLHAAQPAGGNKRPIDALKQAQEKVRKPIMFAPGKDPIRFNPSYLDDYVDALLDKQMTQAGGGAGGAAGGGAGGASRLSAGRPASPSLLDQSGQPFLGRLLNEWTEALEEATAVLFQPDESDTILQPASIIVHAGEGPAGQEQDAMEEDEDLLAGRPVAIAYDQAAAEFGAIDVARAVKREHRRRAEAAAGTGSAGAQGDASMGTDGASGETGMGTSGSALSGTKPIHGHGGPTLSDAELSLLETAVQWARGQYLKNVKLPDPAPSPSKSPRRREGGSDCGSRLFATGLSGAAIGTGSAYRAGVAGAGAGASVPASPALFQPNFQQAGAGAGAGDGERLDIARLPVIRPPAAVYDALERLSALGRLSSSSSASTISLGSASVSHGAMGMGRGASSIGGVVVVGAGQAQAGVGGSGMGQDDHVSIGHPAPSYSSSSAFTHVGASGSNDALQQALAVARDASSRADRSAQAVAALADVQTKALAGFSAQIGDLAGSLGTLVAHQVQTQASLAASLQNVTHAVQQLQSMAEARRGPEPRKMTASIPAPAPPVPDSVRSALASMSNPEKQAGIVLSELASMDLDLEVGHGGTPALADLLPPAPAEVNSMFDELSATLRRGLMAAAELRTAWAASKRALLSVPTRVDVERRLVMRSGLDSDQAALQWANDAGQETRLFPPPSDNPNSLDAGGEEQGIITLGEGRVAAEYHVANSNLRAHVRKLNMQLAASQVAQAGRQAQGGASSRFSS